MKVAFKAYNKVAGDRIWVMVVKEHDSKVAEIGVPVAFSTTGSGYITDTVVLDSVDFGDAPLHIAFMSEQGEFYVDDIKISLIVPQAGTVVEKPYKTLEVTDTSCVLDNLPEGITDYAYSVMVKRTKDFLAYASNYSNPVNVRLLTTGVENVEMSVNGKSIKVISAGRLLIVREGKVYNALGVRL